MKLEEVLPALRAGKKITFLNAGGYYYYENRDIWFFISAEQKHVKMGCFCPLDMMREDWEIVEEKKCELCKGTKKIFVFPFTPGGEFFVQDVKTIDCPECCK